MFEQLHGYGVGGWFSDRYLFPLSPAFQTRLTKIIMHYRNERKDTCASAPPRGCQPHAQDIQGSPKKPEPLDHEATGPTSVTKITNTMSHHIENSQGAHAAQSWETQPWDHREHELLKMQRQVFKHAKSMDISAMHAAQRHILQSWSARALAVRQVAELNTGKRSAGIDGVASLSAKECFSMAERLDIRRRPRPTRRVNIPKPNGEGTRPLSVPTMEDRAIQTLVRLAIEPALEAWSVDNDPNSYGFRPGRGVPDAVSACRKITDKLPRFVLSADIKSCFDEIKHGAIITNVRPFPALERYLVKVLRAGAVSDGAMLPTTKGTPQGGPLSGVLINFALLGLEKAVRSATPGTHSTDTGREAWGTFLVRYADDIRVFHRDLAALNTARTALVKFLAPLGLQLNDAKTTIRHTLLDLGEGAGFDFLGFTIRQHDRDLNGQRPTRGYTTIITPSASGLNRHYRNLATVVNRGKAISQDDLIAQLNDIIRGWSNSKRSENSKATFRKLDHLLFKKLWAWAKRRHGNKSRSWLVQHYFTGGRPWVFTSGKPGAPVLFKHASVEIVPHVKVRAIASPFDSQGDYWKARQHRVLPQGTDTGGSWQAHPLHRQYRRQSKVTREVAQSLRVHSRGRMDRPTPVQIFGEPDEAKVSSPVLMTGSGREA